MQHSTKREAHLAPGQAKHLAMCSSIGTHAYAVNPGLDGALGKGPT